MGIRWRRPEDAGRPAYDGAVIGTVGREVRVMSDVWDWVSYAQVWDGEKVIEISYGYADLGGITADVAVDATDDVKAKVAVWRAAEAAKAERARRERVVWDRAATAAKVAVGKDVTVVRGRKVKVGTEGRVFWLGNGRFGMRAGLELANGDRVFTALSNLEVTNPDDYMDVGEAMDFLAAA